MTNARATNYRQIGDTSLDLFRSELDRLGSPWQDKAASIYAVLSPHTALALAMGTFENKWGTTGIIIKPDDNNPFSLRPWEADPRGTLTGVELEWDTRGPTGRTVRVPPGAVGTVRHPQGGSFLRFGTIEAGVLEWRRRLFDDPGYKNGVYVGKTTLREMIDTYSPPGDIHPITGKNNADIKYAETVQAFLERYQAAEGNVAPPEPEPIQPPAPEPTRPVTPRPYIVILAGHRATGEVGTGAPGERDITDDMARAAVDEFRRRGYEANWWHRDLDRDDLPDQTRGTLSTVVNGLREHLKAWRARNPDRMAVLLDFNFNGAESVQHVLVADGAGLGTGYPDGRDPKDTMANNPLDVELASQVARNIVAQIPGTKLFSGSGTPRTPGVMSEKTSYVGGQGSRLGVFAGTAIFRSWLARLILETGGTNDFKRYPNFAARVAKATADAVDSVYGVASTPTEPEAPTPVYPKPLAIPALDAAGEAWRAYVDVEINGVRYRAFRSPARVRAQRATRRRQFPDLIRAEVVGPDIPAGLEFDVAHVLQRADQPDAVPMARTPWGTFVDLRDVAVIGAVKAA